MPVLAVAVEVVSMALMFLIACFSAAEVQAEVRVRGTQRPPVRMVVPVAES